MSLKALVEVLLHVDTFRNIDLFYQGLYFIRFRLYYKRNHESTQLSEGSSQEGETYMELVQPYWNFETKRQEDKNKRYKTVGYDQHNMIPPSISQDQSSFNSKAFLIRFCEEEVEINDIVLFRAEIDVEPEYLNTEFYLECELNYSDINELGGPSSWKQNRQFYQQKAVFKSVQTQSYKMARLPTGICEFVPVNFQGQFFSLLNIQVQSVMLDLRFRQISVSPHYDKIKNVTEFLFADHSGQVPQQLDRIQTENIYNDYRRVHQRMYARIQNLYSFYRQFLPDKDVKTLNHDQAGAVGSEDPQLDFSKLPMDQPAIVADQILISLNTIASHTVILQHQLTELFKHESTKISKHLQLDQNRLMSSKIEESIIRQVIPTNNFALMSYNDGKISEEDLQEQHKKCAKSIRLAKEHAEELTMGAIDQLNITWLDQGRKQQAEPILFEECYAMADNFDFIQQVKSSTKVTNPNINQEEKSKGIHLFVLVHGFQGNHNDLRGLKNRIALKHPESLFLLAQSNEDKTEEDIMEMGERLAKEVRQFIIESCPGSSMRRLSFIGFSLGGLICRAAFPLLEAYQNKFFTFISLSSPHLGYMYNSNKLFETGMWILKKWKKSKSLAQLSMSDGSTVEQSCLYKLSTMPGLGWFDNILLFCSNQDQYVPFDSARIQICKEALIDNNGEDRKRGNFHIQMSWNLLQKLNTKLLYRIDVDFQIETKQVPRGINLLFRNMDSWIGRAAHIKLLESPTFLQMLTYRYDEFLS